MRKWKTSFVISFMLLLTACSEPSSSTSGHLSQSDTNQPNTVEEYTTTMRNVMTIFIGDMNNFALLNEEGSANPLLFTTNEWIQNMQHILASMEQNIIEIRAVTPPDSMKDSHDELLRAMDGYQFLVDNYPIAIDELDVDLLNECNTQIVEANAHINKATKLVQGGN